MAAKKKSAMDKRLSKAQRVLSGYAKSGRKTAQATVDELARLFGSAAASVIGSGTRKKTGRTTTGKTAKRKTATRKAATRKTAARKTSARKTSARKNSVSRGRPAIKRAATAKRGVTKRSAPKRAGRPMKRGRKTSR